MVHVYQVTASPRLSLRMRDGELGGTTMADWLELLDEFFKSEQKKSKNECQVKEKGMFF